MKIWVVNLPTWGKRIIGPYWVRFPPTFYLQNVGGWPTLRANCIHRHPCRSICSTPHVRSPPTRKRPSSSKHSEELLERKNGAAWKKFKEDRAVRSGFFVQFLNWPSFRLALSRFGDGLFKQRKIGRMVRGVAWLDLAEKKDVTLSCTIDSRHGLQPRDKSLKQWCRRQRRLPKRVSSESSKKDFEAKVKEEQACC